MWQDLAEVINTLIAEYQKLEKLGREKRSVLAAVDLKGLEKLVHQEEAIIATINKTEKQRQAVISQLAKQYIQINPDMTMRDVWGQCPDGQMRDSLMSSHKQLENVVKNTQELQGNNEIMISAALEAINYKLNQLGGTSVEPSYGSGGQEKVTHEKNFDLEV
ncbi:MAG: flagellar protein FlgN [Anaerovibrio sp.]|uniref:flagellar protein FlgN n=1 Tax=Anaerovibrio sp. TaxID=1872532 RepID=UPI0025E1FE75|nr:flagellar protein FlgN [Anaerovibrio sp.]MCR5176496.1 flagellar protein FlgN [Anaerovibrio sp.]